MESMTATPRTSPAATPDGRKKPEDLPDPERPPTDDYEGATDEQVGDRTGPGVGYDQEPVQERDRGGVS